MATATSLLLTSSGVGTELKRLLHKMGINPTENCKCNQLAWRMDTEGIVWCGKNIELIVDWLQEEAENRCLPFARILGKILVKRAIRMASKKNPCYTDPIHELADKFEMSPNE